MGHPASSRSSTLKVAAAGFLLVSAIGGAASYLVPNGAGSEAAVASAAANVGADDELLESLTDYARSIGGEQHASMASAGTLLPDMNTMIERLAARLETTPGDVNGWRMLGWSYSNMARYGDAARACAKAVELDPASAELKQSYEEAKAKAASDSR